MRSFEAIDYTMGFVRCDPTIRAELRTAIQEEGLMWDLLGPFPPTGGFGVRARLSFGCLLLFGWPCRFSSMSTMATWRREMAEYHNDASQKERREALKADCYFNRTQTEVGSELGRFAHLSKTTVVGASPSPVPKQPANSPFHHDPTPAEAPLGYSVDDMVPTGTPTEIAASIKGVAAADPALEAAQQQSLARQLAEQEAKQRSKDRRY